MVQCPIGKQASKDQPKVVLYQPQIPGLGYFCASGHPNIKLVLTLLDKVLKKGLFAINVIFTSKDSIDGE